MAAVANNMADTAHHMAAAANHLAGLANYMEKLVFGAVFSSYGCFYLVFGKTDWAAELKTLGGLGVLATRPSVRFCVIGKSDTLFGLDVSGFFYATGGW